MNVSNLVTSCLDHGFVRCIETMGDDNAIVQAARVSYGTGTDTVRKDTALIRYLLRHRHTTPFEMCEIKFHCKMPIFVARQWVRHRTASINEYSARYSVLDKEFYIPELENLGLQNLENKQGRAEPLDRQEGHHLRESILHSGNQAYERYGALLAKGVSREIARMVLPVNIYIQWYWKIDLHNLLHFLKLRLDPHAQYEIRVYAEAMFEIVKSWVPIAAKAFEDYQLNAVTLSAQEIEVLQSRCIGQTTVHSLSHREEEELTKLFPSHPPLGEKP